MDAILIVLNAIMVCALWCKRGCKWFALIQTVQFLEIPWMLTSGDITIWMNIDQVNILLEILAIVSTRRLRWARALILIHVMAKLIRYGDIDCTVQLIRGLLYESIYILNNVILLTLLGYSLWMPILRLKEKYVNRTNKACAK